MSLNDYLKQEGINKDELTTEELEQIKAMLKEEERRNNPHLAQLRAYNNKMYGGCV